jgi:mono/diheme cytochrome c family protein
MPAWGAPGGGPLTDQQLDNVITYLESLQLPAEEAKRKLEDEIAKVCAPDAAGNCTVDDPNAKDQKVRYENLGEALFNLGLYSGFQGGAYSCGRCHSPGWSYGERDKSLDGSGGRSGYSLDGAKSHFETATAQADFVSLGSEQGKKIGSGPVGDGRMPGFGTNPEAEEGTGQMSTSQVMYSPEQIAAIIDYERGL